MNILLVILTTSLVFAASPPDCRELGGIIEDYDKKLQGKVASECQKLTLADLEADLSAGSSSFVDEYKCSSLSLVEAHLEKLKIEQAILSGIDKLKTVIQVSQDDAGNSNLTIAREAGNKFLKSLNTAQSIETLLYSSIGDKPFLEKLQGVSKDDFRKKVAEICKTQNKSANILACGDSFKPTDESIVDILAMIDGVKVDRAQNSKWTQALAIQKKKVEGEEPKQYLFSEMQKEMESAFIKLEKGEALGRAELNAIKKLDQFENAGNFEFVKNLLAAKDASKNALAVDKFRFVMEDGIRRQQHEIQSKISHLLTNTQVKNLLEDNQEICASAKTNYSTIQNCLSHLQKKARDITDGEIKTLIDALNNSSQYESVLSSTKNKCLSGKELSFECLNEISAREVNLAEEISQFNALKVKILSNHQDLLKYRDFAILKWTTQKCDGNDLDSSMDFCESDGTDQTISKEAQLLTSDFLNVALVYAPKPQVEDEMKKICESEEVEKKSTEKQLCDFFRDTTSNIVTTHNNQQVFDGPVNVENGRNLQREAFVNGLSHLAREVFGQLTPRPPMPTNPYNYGAFNGARGAASISTKLLTPSVMQGSFFYRPSPGLPMGRAF